MSLTPTCFNHGEAKLNGQVYALQTDHVMLNSWHLQLKRSRGVSRNPSLGRALGILVGLGVGGGVVVSNG